MLYFNKDDLRQNVRILVAVEVERILVGVKRVCQFLCMNTRHAIPYCSRLSLSNRRGKKWTHFSLLLPDYSSTDLPFLLPSQTRIHVSLKLIIIMDISVSNETQITSDRLGVATIIWCLLMPLAHLLSLLSNILCIIIFSSKTFIHKPIAIYFIGLLISDSTTLLLGYSEMLDRESHMIDTSVGLCTFNHKVIHNLTDWMYSIMGRFCLEWMLYKVLWTRASTILLAILSVQRTRTFFSLSYHESRLCAVLACIASLLLALLITCLEWIGIRCGRSADPNVYMDILQNIQNRPASKEFYLSYLTAHYNESIKIYSCVMQTLNLNQVGQDCIYGD